MSRLGTPATGVVVTGGASGIGRACAIALAEVGRPVAVWDRSAQAARQLAADLARDHGVRTVAVEIDLAGIERLPDAVRVSSQAIGPIGGLAHCAGIMPRTPIDTMDLSGWDHVNDVNVRAQAFTVQALLPSLRAAGPGAAIVGIASVAAWLARSSVIAYSTSKAAMLGLTNALAAALGPDGIRVNAICPGYIETPLVGTADAARERLQDIIPLGRLGEAREVATVARFLLSDEATYITGSHLTVDGGMSHHGPARGS
ncbi:MAG TPA: SDR family NAD(P)-dependent oxidoreductase [Pseudonocardia sp.]|jgi:NAD(P)-dependent dehydrogenase (short-subunit alcohol dehydrogenase family)|nr:SDR family NAD(P)-dependent oxidoreductase [Pseudonocardia sp.]